MRVAIVLFLSALASHAEFLRIDVSFEDIGCASCIESLEGRLRRVRGVERVEIDPAKGLATLHLESGNQVRLAPLLSRITQDGTKILRTKVKARGIVTITTAGRLFKPSGLAQSYRLELPAEAATAIEDGAGYRVTGEVAESGPGDEPVLTAETIAADSAGGE